MPRKSFTYIYKTVGHCQIKADVYRPADSTSPVPTLVWIHGGCLMYGSRKGINPAQLDLYLDAGYAVVSIDYRLAPETKLPYIIDDLRDAFRWVRREGPQLFNADPDRLATVGHSAGGYLTLMSGCCVDPPPCALVSFYGYGDIVADWYAKPDPFYCQQPAVSEEESGILVPGRIISEAYEGRTKDSCYLYCRQNGLWPYAVSDVDPEADPDFFAPYCPVRNVSAAYPPTLLLHGTEDTDVPYSQSVQMADELERQQTEHRLITIQDGGHGFDGKMEDTQVKEAFTAVLEFLNRHLRS